MREGPGALGGGPPRENCTMRHITSIFVLLALAGEAKAETITKEWCRKMVGPIQNIANNLTRRAEDFTKYGEELTRDAMKVTMPEDLKHTLEVNDQARIAFIKSLSAYRDTFEDLGRQMQLCARQ